ncbi:radical SAM family heme chaperone HemW [Neisseria animalis]|uniref:Heme chaperone HemW n=1 Tax=Neisseria animalis TaxID=492 RepID=A0A5P3MV89_NEIAN|nr:radical SAM family heme chaperone HemW [Neisseria animalis]QEY24579.1 oxygen-independent coproporphyrinogen III oxidase-like protein [Neisseria animalis]ROW33006.1 oxygen-independent coproporphyrinogen III oxidase-like protein [Neisseria animalis]VEE07413.1 coproporphyrinogen III oxidase [Neisseria animalis]
MNPVIFPQAGKLTALPPLSLYIHIPWCIKKCPYCDFNSHSIKNLQNGLPEAEYTDALLADLQTELPHVWGRAVETVFIGGGTPSLFSAAAIDRLLSGIRALVKLQPEAEITLEANPGTFETEKFKGFKDAGITRLSIGVQSFNDEMLARLGRVHNSGEALKAIDTALNVFEKVNIDLMYALPKQTVRTAFSDVNKAIATGATHISAYHLTMEPNTVFGHTPPQGLPQDEAALDIEDAVHAALAEAGFKHYETSAFAKAGKECRHNLNYWQFGDYLGIGAGAHGKISHHDRIERTTRRRHPSEYLAAMRENPTAAIERKNIAADDLAFEFMMNALRLTDGVPAAMLQERTGVPTAQIMAQIETARRKGLLENDPAMFRPTAQGRLFLNDLLQCFL